MELKESSDKTKWMDREPYAYWKGNTLLGPVRRDLVKCNVSKNKEWNARIYDLVETAFSVIILMYIQDLYNYLL